MSVWAVLATGPSLTPAVVQSVKGRCSVVAVSNAWTLAPWADVLVSSDAAWWKAHPEALQFAGRKFGVMPDFRAVNGVERFPAETSTNSGLLGLKVAVSLGATRVLLCGLDMSKPGEHFFGAHPAPLKSTTEHRMEIFRRQFAGFRPRGVQIFNCTPGSALKVYPHRDLEDCLAESAALGA